MTREDEELVKALRNSYGYSEQRDREAAAELDRLTARVAELTARAEAAEREEGYGGGGHGAKRCVRRVRA